MLTTKKLIVSLIPLGLLSVVAIAVAPSSALAFQYEHHYCNNSLAPNGTCPPNGVNGGSEWAHLELNEGDSGGQSHETCIDEYLSNSGYTAAECMYYAGQEAKEYPGGEYGYPRAWNGGSVTHQVVATEYGYHTSAIVKLSASSMGSAGPSAHPLPAAVVQGLSSTGPDPSSAVFAGGTYATWVIPGSSQVCLVHAAMGPGDVPGGVCGSTTAAAYGLAVTTENAAGAPVVLGLVPTGNTAVVVTDANGGTNTVPVANGVYEITGGSPSTVTLKDASGNTITRQLPTLSVPAPSALLEPTL
jgi:hypothetical protein